METVTCDLCGHDNAVDIARTRHSGIELTNVICKTCALVYLNPRMTATEYHHFYAKEYREACCGSAAPTEHTIHEVSARARHICAMCESYLQSKARVVEIGCATGGVLRHIRGYFGCEVSGVEPSIEYQAFAEREYGLDVFLGTLEEYASCPVVRPDVVILSHVLEHFLSPRSALEIVRDLMGDGGILYVEVPNLFFHKCFGVAHPYSFYVGSLKNMLSLTGFEVLSVHTHGKPKWARVPYFISIVARASEPGKPNFSSADWRRVIQLRRLGRSLAVWFELVGRCQSSALRVVKHFLSPAHYARLRSAYWSFRARGNE